MTLSGDTVPLRAGDALIPSELHEKLHSGLTSTRTFRSERTTAGSGGGFAELQHSILVGDDALITLEATGRGGPVFSGHLEITWNKVVDLPPGLFGAPPPLSQCETQLEAKLLSRGAGENIDSPQVAKRPVLAKLKQAMGLSDATCSHAQILAAVIAKTMHYNDFLEYFALGDHEEKNEKDLYWQVQQILEAHRQSIYESNYGGNVGPAAKEVELGGEHDE